MKLTSQELVGYQIAELAKASSWRVWLLVAQMLIATVAAVSVFVDDQTALLYMAILVIGLLIWWGIVGMRHWDHREAGETARRSLLLIEGLGHSLSAAEELEVRSKFRVSPEVAEKKRNPTYFASKAPAGPLRLCEMLEESAYYTSALHMASFWWSTIVVLIIVGIIGTTTLVALPHVTTPTLVVSARVLLSFIVLCFSAELGGVVLGHFQAGTEVATLRRRLTAVHDRGAPIEDVLLLMVNYNSAVESGPTILSPIFAIRRKGLGDSWASYEASRAPGA